MCFKYGHLMALYTQRWQPLLKTSSWQLLVHLPWTLVIKMPFLNYSWIIRTKTTFWWDIIILISSLSGFKGLVQDGCYIQALSFSYILKGLVHQKMKILSVTLVCSKFFLFFSRIQKENNSKELNWLLFSVELQWMTTKAFKLQSAQRTLKGP